LSLSTSGISLSTLVINTDFQSILLMFRLAVVGIALIGVLVSLILGGLMLIPWEVSGILVTAFIGIPGLILAYLSLKEKKNSKETKPLEKESGKYEQPRKPRTILEETCAVDGEEYVFYDLNLKKKETVKGKISSDDAINFYFLTKNSLASFENNRDFYYEYGSESILKSKVNFTPSKTGTWYLVIKNEGEDQATVDIHLFV